MTEPPEVTDSRGIPIVVDSVVAYNRSGDVILGDVINIGPSKVHILPRRKLHYFAPASKVKHRGGRAMAILVLQDPDGDLHYP